MEDLTGKWFDKYQIISAFGQGGMATIYKAYQPSVDRYVAVKVLPHQYANDPQFMGRFKQEAKIVAKLQHPHILPIFDYGESDGYTYLVMPLIGGGTLEDLIKNSPIAYDETKRIISQLCEALEYAHSEGLVHRDVKPSNVLLDEQGNCLLSDFGITKILEGTVQFTHTGGFVGTPIYVSPEQGLGQKLDGRSDIYSLGVILYQMITGRVPYNADTPMAVVIKHIYDPLPLPRTIDPSIPEAVEMVLLKALAKNAEDRFSSATQLSKALRAALSVGEEKTQIVESFIPVQTVIEPQHGFSEVSESFYQQGIPLTDQGDLIDSSQASNQHRNYFTVVFSVSTIIVLAIAGFFIYTLSNKAHEEAEVITTPKIANTQHSTLVNSNNPVETPLTTPTTIIIVVSASPGAPTHPVTLSNEEISMQQTKSPDEFIRDYYAAINQGEYDLAFSWLSKSFKDKYHCCEKNGSYKFDEYVNWWETVNSIEIQEIEIRNQDNFSYATVYASLRFYYQDNRVVDDQHIFQLISDGNGNWLIDDQGG